MNHFNPILNKYNTVKKKLKAKVTERKELNVQKDKTSILNPMFSPIVHGNLNIRGNRRCDEISLFDLRKGHMIYKAMYQKFSFVAIQIQMIKFLSHKHTSISLASLYLKAGERTNLQKGAKNKRTTISNDTLIVLTANQGL